MAFLGKGGGINHLIQVNFGSIKRFKTLYFVKCRQLLRRCFFCAWFWKKSHSHQFAFHAWLVYVWLFHTLSIEYPDMVFSSKLQVYGGNSFTQFEPKFTQVLEKSTSKNQVHPSQPSFRNLTRQKFCPGEISQQTRVRYCRILGPKICLHALSIIDGSRWGWWVASC